MKPSSLPFSERVSRQAADWLTLLMSGEATEADQLRLQQWRDADPEHERAWRHVERFRDGLGVMHPAAAGRSLRELHSPERRQALKAFVLVGAAGGAGLMGMQTRGWQTWTADYRTGTGAQDTIMLADGSRLVLNSGTAVNVRFDASRRVLQLVAGEIMVTTGHALHENRPFLVETAEGSVQALGTRFSVRQKDDRTQVAVLESAVDISPFDVPSASRVLQAGQQVLFSRTRVEEPSAAGEESVAWTRGLLVVDNQRLDVFLAELERYHSGVLRCDPAVAGLRFSGVFPLAEPDRALAMLPSSLPVRVNYRTRYWVTVTPR